MCGRVAAIPADTIAAMLRRRPARIPVTIVPSNRGVASGPPPHFPAILRAGNDTRRPAAPVWRSHRTLARPQPAEPNR
jgi:hypothetical protein